jgi:hypothetical protein
MNAVETRPWPQGHRKGLRLQTEQYGTQGVMNAGDKSLAAGTQKWTAIANCRVSGKAIKQTGRGGGGREGRGVEFV